MAGLGRGEISADSDMLQLAQGMAALPVALLVIGILCLLCFVLAMCLCGKRCAPKGEHEQVTRRDGSTHFKKDIWVFGPFFFFVGATILASHMVFIGQSKIQGGLKGFDESLESVKVDIIDKMHDDSESVSEIALRGLDRLDVMAGCDASPAQDDFNDFLDAFEDIFVDLEDLGDSMTGTFADFSASIDEARSGLQNVMPAISGAIWSLYVFYFGIAASYGLTEICETKVFMQLLIAATFFIETISLVWLSILLALCIALSTICSDPIKLILTLSVGGDPADTYKQWKEDFEEHEDSGGDDGDWDGTMNHIMMFYLYRTESDRICSGVDSLGNALDDIKELTDILTDTVSDFESDFSTLADDSCDLGVISDTFSDFADLWEKMTDRFSCNYMHNTLVKLIEDDVCDGLITGIDDVWAAQFFSSTFIFFMMVYAGIAYQYFGDTHSQKVAATYEDDDTKGSMEMMAKAEVVDDLDTHQGDREGRLKKDEYEDEGFQDM